LAVKSIKQADGTAAFRVDAVVSSDAPQIDVPAVRLRVSSEDFRVTHEHLIYSFAEGQYAPTETGKAYSMFFSQPAGVAHFRLFFDVLNFDGIDAANVVVALNSLSISAFDPSSLLQGEIRTVADLSFAGNANGFAAYDAVPHLRAPEITEVTDRGLRIAGEVEQSDNESPIFGFFGVTTNIPYVGGQIYRVTWTVSSDAPSGAELSVPTFRLRIGDSTLQSATLLVVNSLEGAILPNDGEPVVYTMWLQAPAEINGANWSFAFDYLHVPSMGDDSTIGVTLEGLKVEALLGPTR
jgi:hypothetical protein